MLLGRRVIGEMLLERIPLNDVPIDSIGAANWLHENYRHKVYCCCILIILFVVVMKISRIVIIQDEMLEYYKKEGLFPQSFSISRHYFKGPIGCHYRPRRLWYSA